VVALKCSFSRGRKLRECYTRPRSTCPESRRRLYTGGTTVAREPYSSLTCVLPMKTEGWFLLAKDWGQVPRQEDEEKWGKVHSMSVLVHNSDCFARFDVCPHIAFRPAAFSFCGTRVHYVGRRSEKSHPVSRVLRGSFPSFVLLWDLQSVWAITYICIEGALDNARYLFCIRYFKRALVSSCVVGVLPSNQSYV